MLKTLKVACRSKGIELRKVSVLVLLLSSLICAGSLGPAAPALNAQTSPQVEAWRELMMKTRNNTNNCYKAYYPNTQWTEFDCTEYTPFNNFTGPNQSISGDYVAESKGTISSAVGTLTIANNDSANGPGLTPNDFSIQLSTNTFTSDYPNCSPSAGCYGQMRFIWDSGGYLLTESWLLGYMNNPANTACPGPAYQFGSDCLYWVEAGDAWTAFPFMSFSGAIMTVDNAGGNITNTMFVPGGFLIQVVYGGLPGGFAGNWKDAEFNTFGNVLGDDVYFNPGTYVDVQLSLQDGTALAPNCQASPTSTAVTTNLQEAACHVSASPSPGIQFEEAVPPILTSLTPNFGPAAGGTTVNLLGEGFTQKMQAVVGGKTVSVTGCTYTNCTFVTPPGEAVQPLEMANLGVAGTPLAFSTPLQFDYVPYGSMAPSIGTHNTTVTISGKGFDTAPNKDTVSFLINGVAVPAVGLSCSSTTVCTMMPPVKPSSVTGTLSVPVTMTVDGNSFSIGGFEYLATPVKTPKPPPCHGICI